MSEEPKSNLDSKPALEFIVKGIDALEGGNPFISIRDIVDRFIVVLGGVEAIRSFYPDVDRKILEEDLFEAEFGEVVIKCGLIDDFPLPWHAIPEDTLDGREDLDETTTFRNVVVENLVKEIIKCFLDEVYSYSSD